MPTKKKEADTEPEVTGPEPNVRFIGKPEVIHVKINAQGKEVVIEVLPPTKINHGQSTIRLPDAETQRAGFYHAEAATIVRLYGHFYKLIQPKG
ncbi:MAG: hypothetical protein ACR2GW_08900 [Pyrinomonadaceae bacterium]